MPTHREYQQGYSFSQVLDKIKTPKRNPLTVGPPIQGLNFYNKPSEIDANESPRCRNARIRRGYIEPRPGLTLFKAGFDSTIMYIREFPISTGALYHLVITLKSIYFSADFSTYTRVPWYYSTGTVEITSGAPTKVVGTGTFWASNAHAGDKFKVTGDTAWSTILTVDSDTGLTLTTSHTAVSALSDYQVDRYFSGTIEDAFWAQTIADVDYFVFSQGVDPVMYIDSNVNAVHRLSDDCPAARYGILFADRLIIANIPDLPFRAQWCVPGDYTDWTGLGSGFNDFVEDPYGITGLSVISGVAVVYKEYSICHMVITGRSDSPFDFKTRIPGIGNFFPGSLLSIGASDVFIGSDNFYLYDLQSISPVGDKVKDQYFAIINPAMASVNHGLIAEEFTEAQWFFASASNTSPDKVWTYNYDMEIFSSEWDMPATASGYATQQTSKTWNSMSGSWDSQTEIWDSSQLQAAVPLNIIGLGTSLYKQDPTAVDDLGVNFEFEWQTKEFKSDEIKYMSVYRVVVDYYCSISATLKVAISGDSGNTFSDEITQTLIATAGTHRAFFDFLGTYDSVIARLKVNDGGKFQLIKVYIQGIPSGEIDE